MGRVRLEVVPPLTSIFGVKQSNRLVLQEEVDSGANIRDLLNRLSTKYPEFQEAIFAPGNQKLTGQVTVILNDRLLELQQVLETNIEDGDTIILLSVFMGG